MFSLKHETGFTYQSVEKLKQAVIKGIRNNLDANAIQEMFGDDLAEESLMDIVDTVMVYVL